MKLVLYDDFNPGILKGDTVVDIASVVAHLEGGHGQHLMEGIIDSFGSLQPELEKVTFYHWLKQQRQSGQAIQNFWSLLVKPTLNDDVKSKTANIFFIFLTFEQGLRSN